MRSASCLMRSRRSLSGMLVASMPRFTSELLRASSATSRWASETTHCAKRDRPVGIAIGAAFEVANESKRRGNAASYQRLPRASTIALAKAALECGFWPVSKLASCSM